MKASHGHWCGASWFDRLTMKRSSYSRSASGGPSAAFAIRPLAPALVCFLGNAGFSQAIDRQLDVGGLEAELSMLDHRLLEIESGIELEQPGHGDARVLGVAELAVGVGQLDLVPPPAGQVHRLELDECLLELGLAVVV